MAIDLIPVGFFAGGAKLAESFNGTLREILNSVIGSVNDVNTELIAWGVVTAAGSLTNGKGATVVRDVEGVYKITLPGVGIPDTDLMMTFTPRHITGFLSPMTPLVRAGTDIDKFVGFHLSTGFFNDTDFYFKIEKLPTS